MLKRFKNQFSDEAKSQREQQRQERKAEQERELQLAAEAEAEELRQKVAFRNTILHILGEGKVPDLGLDVDVPFKLQKGERWLLATDDGAVCGNAGEARNSGQVGRDQRSRDEGRVRSSWRVARHSRRNRRAHLEGERPLCRLNQAHIFPRRPVIPDTPRENRIGSGCCINRLGNRP